MFRLMNNLLRSKVNNTKVFSLKLSDKPQVTNVKEPSPTVNITEALPRNVYKPNNFERTILVWTKMYKSKEDIPSRIAISVLEKARSKARIKVANYMMLATALGCVAMVISGKRAAQRGESVSKMNLDWHKKMNEESSK